MISVTIHRKTLVRHEACVDGLAFYDAIAALQPETDARRDRRIRIANWTPLHSIWAWVTCAGFASWCEEREREIIPRADLSGANLSRANLSGAYRGSSSSSIPGWRTRATGYLERESPASSDSEGG